VGRAFARAPRVLDTGADDTGAWLVTSPVLGESAVSERWRHQPAEAVAAIGRGLRHLHDHAPVSECPFSWSLESRLQVVHQRIRREASSAHWHPDHRALSVDSAVAILDAPPSVDLLVVCHGDACAPNTLVTELGAWSGHVDFGALGTADRWADLAVATWSTEWNYGPGWDRALLDAYGIDFDPDRTRYYRLLWDLA
jgi:kanamycin kinase